MNRRRKVRQRHAATQGTALAPMVELLEDELQAVGLPTPSGSTADSSRGFSRWYLEAVQLLEAHVAHCDGHAPVTREDVELMCRCAMTSTTLAGAMRLVQQFLRMLYPRAGGVEIVQMGNRVRFINDSMRSERTMASSLVDIAGLFAFKQLFLWLTGGRGRPVVVGIGSMQRFDVLPFLRLFSAPVVAEGEHHYLEFELASLDAPVVASTGDFDEFFRHFPCAIFELDTELELQVAAMISAAVNQALPIPSQVQVARTLAMPLSTFRRRLADQGTSFRVVRDSCLLDSAQTLLQQDQLSVGQVAQRVGFKDADTFRKAFHRWTGCSPTEWRKNQTG